MSQLSNYAEGKLIEHLLRNVAYTSPATVYLALFTAAPGEAGGGTEVAGSGYARQAVAFGAHSDGVCSNTGAIAFTANGGNWGVITHVGIFDASSGGNLLMYGPMTNSRTINDGETLNFAIGEIDASLA